MARFWTPAWWLTIVLISLAFSPTCADAQSRRRPPAKYLGGHQPDQAEGAQILEDMRNIVLMGSYYQEFELRLLPRKGPERRLAGRAFGNSNEQGPIMRVELMPGSDNPEILLVQNGPQPQVWRLQPDQEAAAVSGADVLQPLVGTTLSAADLQIPFMYWTDFVFEGREPFRGRPTFIFLLFPPAHDASLFPGIGGARVFLDTQFRAPIQAEWIDEAGGTLKTITILDLKKVHERYIVKSFEVRDERTRDKTRFQVRAVAFDARLPGEWFSPAGPATPVPDDLVPAERQIVN